MSVGTSGTEWWEIREKGKQLFLYGLIEYRDIAERPFWSRFCYLYHVQAGFNPLPTGWYVGGPPAYNKAT